MVEIPIPNLGWFIILCFAIGSGEDGFVHRSQCLNFAHARFFWRGWSVCLK